MIREAAIDELVEGLANELVGTADDLPADYPEYQGRPTAFVREILDEIVPPDVERFLETMQEREVVLARSANATGKTWGAARWMVYLYKCYPVVEVYCTAAPPESNLKNLLWAELQTVVHEHPHLFAGDNIRDLKIDRNPFAKIRGLLIPQAASDKAIEERFSGKHSAVISFIVDEGLFVPRAVYQGIDSCLSGGMARLGVLFNPRDASGVVYEMERDRKAAVVELSAFNHPNVRTGIDQIPGAVTREKTVQRINDWSRPIAGGEKPDDSDVFEVPDFLVGTQALRKDGSPFDPLPAGHRKVEDRQIYYMVLAKYPPEAEERLFQEDWIQAALDRGKAFRAMYGDKPPAFLQAKGLTSTGVAGLDVADTGPDFNVLYARYGGYLAPPDRWRGLEAPDNADHAAPLIRQKMVRHTNVDGTGFGGALPALLRRRKLKAHKIIWSHRPTAKPSDEDKKAEFFQLRDQMYWAARTWLRDDPSAMLPDEDRLIEELRVPTHGLKNGKVYIMSKDKMKKELRRSPDDLEAFVLTFAPPPRRPNAFRSMQVGTAPVVIKQRRR